MKTLIFNGSPRKNGDTSSLVSKLLEDLTGEHKIVHAYDCGIQPCMDCRYCWKNRGCCIHDNMQEVYAYIQECDNILIASPIYFSELTGALLNVASRLQTYYCARFFRKEKPIPKKKKGAVILVGGGDGNMDQPYHTACILLRHMNANNIYPVVCYHNTNNQPAIKNKTTMCGFHGLVRFFNGA